MVMYLNRNTFVSEGYKAAVRTVCWVLVDPSLLGRQGRAESGEGRGQAFLGGPVRPALPFLWDRGWPCTSKSNVDGPLATARRPLLFPRSPRTKGILLIPGSSI